MTMPSPHFLSSIKYSKIKYILACTLWLISLLPTKSIAHPFHLQRDQLHAQDPFRQLEELWPTPNEVRLASGAPGPAYWQQRVDYEIKARLNDQTRMLEGVERITYHNQSPHTLTYLWIQLDQNRFRHDSLSTQSQSRTTDDMRYGAMRALKEQAKVDRGHHIHWVHDSTGQPLTYTIVDTMMRVELPTPIQSGAQFIFSISWSHRILKHELFWARSGFEELKSVHEKSEALKKIRQTEFKRQQTISDAETVALNEAKLTSKASDGDHSTGGVSIESFDQGGDADIQGGNADIQGGDADIQGGAQEGGDIGKNELGGDTGTGGAERGDAERGDAERGNTDLGGIEAGTANPNLVKDQLSTDQLTTDQKRRIYEVAQWFPRLAAYTDVNGWQNKPFLGRGEFTLEFGDYKVWITVPNTHTVAATGTLQNPDDVLTPEQKARLTEARSAKRPVFIISPAEADQREKRQATSESTWYFEAKNVRDFSFASSNAFIWDAWGYQQNTQSDHFDVPATVLAMSFYPSEAEPLWSKYSTQAIVHTLEEYGHYAFPYPYPVAISVNGPVYGMEYPMITFNGPRPHEDGTYSQWAKYGLISVIIHEIGHVFFPMVVNSDERQWTWMDEGINSFLQMMAERSWEERYPAWRGEPYKMAEYMSSKEQVPIMTNSESILQFGQNAYAKPSAALSVLRESIMGPTLFDLAFKTYAQRWAFKRPQPSDFFRTMEDASGVDLDWFWRGWFYSTLAIDIAVTDVKQMRLKTLNPDLDKAYEKAERDTHPKSLMQLRDEGRPMRVDRFPELKDFYSEFDALDITPQDRDKYQGTLKGLKKWQQEQLKTGGYFYQITLRNVGGLITHVPLRLVYEDEGVELRRIPAEVWRKNPEEVSLLYHLDQPLKRVEVDPHYETPDIDRHNNHYPQRITKEQFSLKESKWAKVKNPMQYQKEAELKMAKDQLEKAKKSQTKTQDTQAQTQDPNDKIQDPKARVTKIKENKTHTVKSTTPKPTLLNKSTNHEGHVDHDPVGGIEVP